MRFEFCLNTYKARGLCLVPGIYSPFSILVKTWFTLVKNNMLAAQTMVCWFSRSLFFYCSKIHILTFILFRWFIFKRRRRGIEVTPHLGSVCSPVSSPPGLRIFKLGPGRYEACTRGRALGIPQVPGPVRRAKGSGRCPCWAQSREGPSHLHHLL